ncbi:TonB-dependent receptor [Amphiplicatus metriothermophilus]|uniref:Iron complex outermembrane recepter protein n=1 Tax=Amphiplicatus metriothermophilus TaxID=1519374 RepID=A0A239PJM1_9PROT|nr:TonB-dependent receptor [Amphiplicatus metriothermophilus]MBB5517829.1 iron complex outermembrane receptor protein [Amphiplicatus metriothermophilus]SNT67837.1 iron complex outermembrane recepter protein [Amphiplicatus metriothermophilus]
MSVKSHLLRYAAASAVAAPLVWTPVGALEPVRSDEIVVTASPLERPAEETIIGVSSLSGEALQRNLANTIGETLRREPGVSSTYFGPGASRPVIRGLGGDRIRVLSAGIGSIDASATSPDHAVAVEPATAEKIEIVRGTAMLLYGSSAAGGVVNVFDGRIPTTLPEDGVDGALRVGGSTADDGVEAAGAFDIRLGELGGGALVFHGDGAYREAEDYDIPGFAESARLRALEEEEHDDHDEEEAFGVLENTAFETKSGAAGLSWIFDRGFAGVSGSFADTLYGVPGGHAHEEEEENGEAEEEGGVTIDLRQRRIDFRSEVDGDFALFKKAKLRVGYADYEHKEIEPSGEVGTVFSNEGWEGRLELIDKTRSLAGAALDGAVGFQWRLRDFSALGEEAFTLPAKSSQYGVFAVKELTTGPWRFELGGRYENTSHRVVETGFERSFDGLSVSGGVGVKPTKSLFLGVTAFRTERAPSTEELFSNGPHLATGAFEVGDPTLGKETALGVEAAARILTDRFVFRINGFYTDYDDFIFEAQTGEEEDGLPVFQFMAANAAFRGFEAEFEAELFQLGAFDIHGDAGIDYVRATTRGQTDDDLPRIPPLSTLVGLEARSEWADLRAEVEWAADQDDVAAFELPTDGYTLVNAYLTLRPFATARRLSLRLSGENLTDEEARLHTSFLKDVAPLPGRNFKFAVRGEF